MIARQFFSMLVSVALLGGVVDASDDLGAPRKPPVLLHSDPPDSAIVTLPGPAPEPVGASLVNETRPFLRRVKREFPPGFEEDSPKFLQEQIGQWKEFDVQELLGKPLRQRPAFDDAGKENGQIYAYDDPLGRYKGLELDFAGDTGELRTVFIYPVKMTWNACRQVYGSNVTSAAMPQGRKFYSYLNRRMDVLVDASGWVISLGFY